MALTLRTNLMTNALVWMTSLGAEDLGATRRTLDTLAHVFQKAQIPIIYFHARSATEFLSQMDAIATKAQQQNFKPIIHIDTHGSEKRGLQIADSNEFVDWNAVSEKLRTINIALRNDLCVVSAACFGLTIIKSVDLGEAAPFYLVVAPERKTYFNFIEEKIVPFYQDIFSGTDLIEAHKRHLKSELALFSSEGLVLQAMASHVREHMIGRGRARRIESIISKRVSEGYSSTPESLRRMRKLYKNVVRPTPEFIKRTTERFMIGRPLSFGLPEILQLARDTKKYPKL